MWKTFQPHILRKVFSTYILYMFIMIYVTSSATETFLEETRKYDSEGQERGSETYEGQRWMLIVTTLVGFVPWSFFVAIEMRQMI